MNRLTRTSTLALFAATAAACSAPGPEEPLGSAGDSVELHRINSYFQLSLSPSGGDAPAQLATGALKVALGGTAGDGVTPLGGTCGVTFVSPSRAITAAHCVAQSFFDPLSDRVTVQMYRPRRDLDWARALSISGTWPSFSHTPLTAADGYLLDEYSCRVERRCGTSWGQYACDSPSADTALLRCDGRPGDRHGFVNIAEVDDPTAEVRMWWKHELYSIPETNTSDPRFEHYSKLTGDRGQNYHYFLGEHQLLPLASRWANDGGTLVPRRKLGSVTATRVSTTLRGCHGTSGSGVFQPDSMGGWELLGPASTGSNMTSTLPDGGVIDRLCHPVDSANQSGLTYAALEFTHDATEGVCDIDPPSGILGWLWCHRGFIELWNTVRFEPWPFPPCPACVGGHWARIFREPMAMVEAKQTLLLPLAKPQPGKRYRFGARIVGSSKAPPIVSVRLDGKTLLTRQLSSKEPLFSAPIAAAFSAAKQAEGKLEIVSEPGSGEFGVLEIGLVPEDVPNTFDGFVERAGAGLQGPDPKQPELSPMRFSGDGKAGFAAELGKGEQLVMTRLGLVVGASWSADFRVLAGKGKLACGLVFEDGARLEAPCSPSQGYASVTLQPDPKAVPVAFFVRALDGDALIDDVRLGTL